MCGSGIDGSEMTLVLLVIVIFDGIDEPTRWCCALQSLRMCYYEAKKDFAVLDILKKSIDKVGFTVAFILTERNAVAWACFKHGNFSYEAQTRIGLCKEQGNPIRKSTRTVGQFTSHVLSHLIREY